MDDIPELPAGFTMALTMSGLAAATVDFLEGRTRRTPSHLSPPDDETRELVPDLVLMNRAGLITIGSQPGMPRDPEGSAQRAYVDGLCGQDVLDRLVDRLADSDLVLLFNRATEETFATVAVTKAAGRPCTFLGRWSPEVLDWHRNGRAGLDAELDDAWYVQIFDPVWGRNDRLFAEVCRVLEP